MPPCFQLQYGHPPRKFPGAPHVLAAPPASQLPSPVEDPRRLRRERERSSGAAQRQHGRYEKWVGGLLELCWNFIGVDRNFIGTVSLRYCYVIATLLLRYCSSPSRAKIKNLVNTYSKILFRFNCLRLP